VKSFLHIGEDVGDFPATVAVTAFVALPKVEAPINQSSRKSSPGGSLDTCRRAMLS
jgi:hypothetical protein